MQFLEKMNSIQYHLIKFLDEDQQNFEILNSLLTIQQSQPDAYELKAILHLISKISKNHHRGRYFFEKIKKIINIFKNAIKQTFTNYEIFQIYKKNKIILLILIEEGVLSIDSRIYGIIKNDEYFYPETTKFLPKKEQKEIPEDFYEKRRIGENDSYICELIRDDNIEEFIIYYNKNGNTISLNMNIKPSIFETNNFLYNKKITLMEYSIFFGSIQIVKFLYQNNVDLNSSLWLYAIHGKNPDLIHFLEENHVLPEDQSYYECLKESIKCFHNDFALYFKNNLIEEIDIQSNYFKNDIYYGFRFYNFEFIPNELKLQSICFFYAVEFGYFKIVEYYKNMKGFDINSLVIFKKKKKFLI